MELEKVIEKVNEVNKGDAVEQFLFDLVVIYKATSHEGIKVKTKNGIKHYNEDELLVDFANECIWRKETWALYDSIYTDDSSSINKYELSEHFDFADYGELWVCENEDFK